MAALQDYQDDFFLMVEAGFIAVNQADEAAALQLFKAAELLNPASTLPQIGFGYMHFLKLELKAAVDVFEKILKKEPQNEMAKALLGLCLSFTPQSIAQGEKILTENAKSSKDGTVKSLSQSALDFVDRFIKKAPGPIQVAETSKKPKRT